MHDVNKVILLGNLSRDPDIQPVGPRATFEVITARKIGNVEEKMFHTVVAEGPRAAFVMNNLTKSTRVYVEGFLRKRRVLRKSESDGLPPGQYVKYDETWEVVATDISTMGGKKTAENIPIEILRDTPGDTFADLP